MCPILRMEGREGQSAVPAKNLQGCRKISIQGGN
jgi:hypothetical protein